MHCSQIDKQFISIYFRLEFQHPITHSPSSQPSPRGCEENEAKSRIYIKLAEVKTLTAVFGILRHG